MVCVTGEMEDIGPGMTNFDHSIVDGVEDALRARANEVYARYAARNFCARVWFDNSDFVAEVWTYGSPRCLFRADSLKDLMETVSDEFGYD